MKYICLFWDKYKLFIQYIMFILGYYVITGIGFITLKQFHIDFTSHRLYIYAIPMMLCLTGYTLFLNKKVLKKYNCEKNIYKLRYSKLQILSVTIVLMIISVFIEAMWKKTFSFDIIIFTVLAFLIGFSEESMFRGFIISFNERFTSSKTIIIISSTIFFAILHMINVTNGLSLESAWNQTIHSIPMGLLAGAIYAYRKAIWPIILWHFSIDYILFMGNVGEFKTLLVFGYIIDAILILETVFLLKSVYLDKNACK